MAASKNKTKPICYFILKFDKEVERGGRLLQPPKHQKVLRGTLLEPISPETQWQEPTKRYQRGGGKLIKLRCLGDEDLEIESSSSEVARITKDEMELLSAIPTANARYNTYIKPDQLTFALGLGLQSHVKVEVKGDSMMQTLPGIVRYIGAVPNQPGRLFGIELLNHPGQGTSDGEFGKKRFFYCEKDSAVFVPVNKLKIDTPGVPQVSEVKAASGGGHQRQSCVEADLEKDMDVYVSTKKGSKEEYVKGKIIYVGKPPNETMTYVGVELEKPRTAPWDGTFKSDRLCTPLRAWYSELVPINDVVPAGLLEKQECAASQASSKGSFKRPLPTNTNAKNTKSKPGYVLRKNDSCNQRESVGHSLTGLSVHASNFPIETITGQNPFTPLTHLAGSDVGGRGQDVHLKMQEQLLNNAKKAAKDSNQTELKGIRRFSKDIMSRLQRLGGHKEGSTLQAELPPLSSQLLQEICSKVDNNWGLFASSLGIDRSRIEKISDKIPSNYDRVLSTLVHWWKDACKQPKSMQTLAFALSEVKLEKLAGSVLIVTESEMDAELLDIVADKTSAKWKILATELGLENEVIDHVYNMKDLLLYKDKARKMLDIWDQEISIGCEKLSLLVKACRHSGFEELANELEQGLDTNTLEKISRLVDDTKWRKFGTFLGFTAEHLNALEKSCDKVKIRVYTMLGAWRNNQPFTSDKIVAISSALENCGLQQLAWEICRGLDEDLLHEVAHKVQNDWKELAEWLRLPRKEINKLASSYTSSAKQAHQVLVIWRKKQHATCDLLGELATVLRTHGYKDLAYFLVQGLHDEILDKVATLVGGEWETLAVHLKFDKMDLDAIKDAYSVEPQRIYRMLCQWRYRQHYSSDRLDVLLNGLKKCGLQTIGEAITHMMEKPDQKPDTGLKPPGEVTDDQLKSIAKQVGDRWQLLAEDLGVSREEIFAICDKHKHQDDQCFQMLLLWRSKVTVGQYAKKILIEALEKCHRHDLVVENWGPQAGKSNAASFEVPKVSDPPAPLNDNQSLNENQLLEIARTVKKHWKLLAHSLGVSTEKVMDIENRVEYNENQCYCMLQNWNESRKPSHAMRQELEQALRRSGHKDLISKLWYSQEDSSGDSAYYEAMNTTTPASKAALPESTETPDVDKEMLLKLSKEVVYNRELVNALQLNSKDVQSLETNYHSMQRRCFQAFDTWLRRGPFEKRKLSELIQALRLMKRSDLARKLTSEAAQQSTNTSDMPSELRADFESTVHNVPKLQENATQERFSSLPTIESAKEAREPMQFSSNIPPENNPYGLEVNSMVEIASKKGKLYGVIRWMGHSEEYGTMAGIELEEKLEGGAGTDGTLLGQRYFTCEERRALFVKFHSVKPDSRFPSQFETFTKRKRFTSQDFGGFPSPTIKGYIHPPGTLSPEFVGREKGIQGDQNSCYLDTTLFSMYAYSNIFDNILHRMQMPQDLKEYDDVQTILREHIVNPLRSSGFVRADRVLKLRHYLDQLGTTKGLTNEEKDPEEFLHTLLQEVTKTEPFLHIRHGGKVEKSYHYQIFMEKNESYKLPTVEQLLHYSFLHSDLKLTQVPPCLIMQMPRFGKDYRMYKRILPSLHLDISDLLEGWPRMCTVCGNLAEIECRECSGAIGGVSEPINSYCESCAKTVHKIRPDHDLKILPMSEKFLQKVSDARRQGWTEEMIQTELIAPRKILELFAVVCIETSHYVAFVKAGSGPDAQWIFFDSMADREGDQQGYNIPEVTHLPDFKVWLENEAHIREMQDKELPQPLRRLLCDGYMCMYQDAEVVARNQAQFHQTTGIDKISEMNPVFEVCEKAVSNEMQVDDSTGITNRSTIADAMASQIRQSPAFTPMAPMISETPAITYTSHPSSSRGHSTKAALNSALCYRNYADAKDQIAYPPTNSYETSRVGYNNVLDNNTSKASSSRSGSQKYDNSPTAHHLQHGEQHVPLPKSDDGFELVDNNRKGNSFQLKLSPEADRFTKPNKETTNLSNLSQKPRTDSHSFPKYSKYTPVSNLPEGAAARVAPIPSHHHTRREVTSDSSSKSGMMAMHESGSEDIYGNSTGLKYPPSLDREFDKRIACHSLSGQSGSEV